MNMHKFLSFAVVLLIAAMSGSAQKHAGRLPVIDMHIHADPISDFGGGEILACSGDDPVIFSAVDPKALFDIKNLMSCPSPMKSSASDAKLITETLAMFDRYNIRRAVTMGPLENVEAWTAAGRDRIIPALDFSDRDPKAEEYRRLYNAGKFKVFGEIGPQYRGFTPADPVWEPYFALAEELDIPVGIHMGEGPPGGVHIIGRPTYRVRLGSPLLLEELIIRHPKLRIYVMHYGSPLVDEMIAMMFSHPNLYVDISCNNWLSPRKQFYDHLRRMVEAGFEKRIMFGSDQMAWPETIGKAIASVEKAPFLTKSQKRDIFYNNAARFLRLNKEEIARDHAKRKAK